MRHRGELGWGRRRAETLTPLGGGQYSITDIREAGRDGEGLWSVQAQEVTDVTFADVQPVFAYRDPKLYFVPEGVQVVRNLPLAPQTGTGIKTPRQPAPTEARAAVEFLRYRRDNLRAIIERTRGEFRGIREWSLFP